MKSRPGPEVLDAFGLRHGLLRRLPGGQGVTWCFGNVVLKPVSNIEETEWVGSVLSDLPERGFRVSRPIPSLAGTWTDAGWSASARVDGAHDFTNRWPDILTVGTAFHTALRDVARPSFLDDRDDAWSMGDLAARDDEEPTVIHAGLGPVVEQLAAFRSPCRLPSQIVHGDLSGNVLFADATDPAIIDFVPYWRPAEFALAVVVADAIAWHQAGSDLARCLPAIEDPRSMLARAAIYRLITSDRAASHRAGDPAQDLQANLEAHGRILTTLRAM